MTGFVRAARDIHLDDGRKIPAGTPGQVQGTPIVDVGRPHEPGADGSGSAFVVVAFRPLFAYGVQEGYGVRSTPVVTVYESAVEYVSH